MHDAAEIIERQKADRELFIGQRDAFRSYLHMTASSLDISAADADRMAEIIVLLDATIANWERGPVDIYDEWGTAHQKAADIYSII